MPYIILTQEQAQSLAGVKGPVDVRDPQGRPVASLRILDADDLEAIERHRRNRGKPKSLIPSARVQAFLRKLHEIAERNGIDEATVKDLLQRIRAGEPLC